MWMTGDAGGAVGTGERMRSTGSWSRGRLWLRRAIHPDGHRPPARRPDCRAAWPGERHRPHRDRAVRRRPRRPLRVSPTSRERAQSGVRLQPLGPAPDGGQVCRLRARRRRGGVPWKPASVLVSTLFNDFNNTHEGDWEMIQLVFDAPDARAALAVSPVEVGFSSHEGVERAVWGDEKLELVDERPSCIRRPAPTPTSTRRRSGSVARPRRAWVVTTRVARTASCRRAS